MYKFLERKFHENYDGDIDGDGDISFFEKITKKQVFCHFSFETG